MLLCGEKKGGKGRGGGVGGESRPFAITRPRVYVLCDLMSDLVIFKH